MEVQFGPNSHDEPNLLYKLQRKVKVFTTSNPLPNRGYNLVASVSKYGIVFVGSPDGKLAVYYLHQLIDKECDPQHMLVQLQERPTHIAVSCDQELLAVTGGQLLVVYKVVDFHSQNVSPALSVKCDVNPSTFVSDLKWNPCIPDTIAIAFFDGTLTVLQASNGQVKKVQAKARCLCWSPKGKQLVVGNSDGTLFQYKPDLSPMKSVPVPNLFQNSPVEALAIHWISTYQFAVVYRNAADNSRPAVCIVNTPKAGQPSCVNYEDICYSMGTNRPWYYYLHGIAQWNMILCSSSNSMEMATLGTADGANWLQWCQPDEARPELPLTDKKQENYPVGICFDTAAIHQLPWGENEKLPPMPMLHVVSQTGLLTIFNVINLSKQASQICAQPQTLTLPAGAMVSTAVEPVSSPPSAPAAAPVPQTKPAQPLLPTPQPSQPVATPVQFSLTPTTASKPFSAPQPQNAPAFGTIAAPQPQVNEPKPPETKPAIVVPTPAPASQPQAQPKPAPPPQKDPTREINAALKAEQELANKQKADQELRSMLIREVNDFQMELYKFVTKTRQAQIQFHRDLQSISPNTELQNLDADAIKKECSLDDLRNAIIALKLDLVRACAVVAEARTNSDAKDMDQWTQADPLTTKRVASVKKLAYYVQSQLEQAHRALDYKWNEQVERDMKLKQPGHRMIRPILDDVYQPLVRQQEILSRQQALLKTLRSTLNECQLTPAFKSSSIVRTTPFKNKDPLSKLTKNILNMSIEPQNNENKNLLTPQKLEALRDMLSNHKTVKIKPVNVEMRHHLTAMRMSYEKSVKEKANDKIAVKVEPKPSVQPVTAKPVNLVKTEIKPEVKQPPTPSFTPINVKPITAPHAVRTLFTEEVKQEPTKPQVQTPVVSKQPFAFAAPATAAAPNTRSVLKDLLQNKQVSLEPKKDDKADSFMGQKICSPSSGFNFSSVIVATPTSFTSKPISELSNMFNKFAPQAFVAEAKSSETGEPDSAVPLKTDANVKEDKPMSNLFAMKTSTPLPANTQNVPDVLAGGSKTFTFKRIETKAETKAEPKPEPKSEIKSEPKRESKPEPKLEPKPEKVEKPKENVPDKSTENVILSIPKVSRENEPKPLSVQNTNKPLFGSNIQSLASSTSAFTSDEVSKPIPIKSEIKTEASKVVPKSEAAPASSASIFATASATITVPKSQAAFGSSAITSSTPAVVAQSVTIAKPQPISSASSIFATAVASSPLASPTKTEPASISSIPSVPKTESGSIFATASTTPSSVFGTSPTSIFGTTTTTQSSIFAPTSTTEVKPAESVPSSTASAPSSVFGSTAKSVFGTSAFATTTTTAAAPAFATATSTPSSGFASTTSTPSAFEAATTTTQSGFVSTIASTQPSVFSTPATTTSSIFGSPTSTTQPSVFGGTQTPVFGSPQTSQPSIFGSPAATQASVFGSPATSQAPVFGSPTTQASVFGSPATTQASVFGSPTTQASAFGSPPTTQSSVFGAPQTTQASMFGSPQTTQASVFGSPTTQTSVFGAQQTNQTSVFGAPSQTSLFGATPTQASVFGTPTQSNQQSVFGSPTQTTQASVFGTPQPATQASVFGTPTQTTQASVFGSPSQTSVFGAPATTAAGSLFGGGESLFASVNISTTSAPSQSSESIFGGGSSGTSVFGSSNTNVFGGKSTFGQPSSQASAIFGGASAFGQTSAAPATNFWGSNNNSGGFGSTGFGQQATTQASSVFGTGSFSSPVAPGQAFGGGDAKPFGSPTQQTGGFGSGFGAKAVFGQAAGFGSPTSSGFGASATFGGFNKSPGGFGASATFGGGAAFGGSAFGGGSPGSVFGGAAPQSGFGSPTQSNATFESLATQNTLTFGNLAQQTSQQAQPAPTFNTSPSFTGWRG